MFENILLLKEFLASNGCFGLFIKIKKGVGAAVGAYFLQNLSAKVFLT